MSDPLVSVIVPVYNTAPYLDECIHSLRGQGYGNLDIVLVDDGSSDGSGVICDRHAAADPRITVIHQVNGGVAVAMNRGLAKARGRLVTFVGSDDALRMSLVENLVAALLDTDSDLAVGGFTRGDVMGGPEPTAERGKSRQVFTPDDLLRSGHALSPLVTPSPCSKVWSRFLLGDAPFPEGRVHEDAMVLHRLVRRAKRVVVTEDQDYFYRVRDDSITGSRWAPTPRYLVDKARAHQMRAADLSDLGAPELVSVEFSKALNYTLLASGLKPSVDAELVNEIRSLRMWLLAESHAFDITPRSHLALVALRWAPQVAARVYARLMLSRDGRSAHTLE